MTAPDPTPESNPLCGADPLARALAKLRPTPSGMDTNRLLFEAGQAARDRSVALWRRAFLGQLVVLVAVGCLATVYFVQLGQVPSAPRVRERIVTVERPAPVPDTPEAAPAPRPISEPVYAPGGSFAVTPPEQGSLAEYLRIRHEVLTAGLGLLPDNGPRPTKPVNADELEKSLHLPPGVLAAPYRQPHKPKAEPDMP